MGTRNLTCAVIDNDYKIAQFGQWDGYPEGVGAKILQFLKEKMDRPLMEKRLREITFLNEEDINLINESGDIPAQFSRDIGGDILELVQNKVLVQRFGRYDWVMDKLFNRLSFAADSLFCEWCYVVDFDKNTFEVYEGFVKEAHTGERFSDIQSEKTGREYYPVKLVKTYDLNNLPSQEEFIEDFVEPEEE